MPFEETEFGCSMPSFVCKLTPPATTSKPETLSQQCAAVNTQVLDKMDPPQNDIYSSGNFG